MGTMRRGVRRAGAGLLGSALLVGLALPAQADPAGPGASSWSIPSPDEPVLDERFIPIIGVDMRRAQAEHAEAEQRELIAQTQRRRAEERTQQAAKVARKRQVEKRKRQVEKFVPVRSGYELTARFGQSGGYWSGGRHSGLDFADSYGSPVRAAQSGKVIAAGWQSSYGNRIEIKHANGTVTTYSHLSQIRIDVGDRVDGGQRIGSMGSTGNATGTHLHFEVLSDSEEFVAPGHWLGLS